jgi:hypothetical protein
MSVLIARGLPFPEPSTARIVNEKVKPPRSAPDRRSPRKLGSPPTSPRQCDAVLGSTLATVRARALVVSDAPDGHYPQRVDPDRTHHTDALPPAAAVPPDERFTGHR